MVETVAHLSMELIERYALRGWRRRRDASGPPGRVRYGVQMLVKQFKFKRNNDKGGFQWSAESEIERPDFHRGFYAVGKTLADVKEFAALVRYCRSEERRVGKE